MRIWFSLQLGDEIDWIADSLKLCSYVRLYCFESDENFYDVIFLSFFFIFVRIVSYCVTERCFGEYLCDAYE